MTWYLYKHPSGAAELTEYPVPVSMRPDLLFMASYEENPPDISGMEFDEENRLRPIVITHSYPDIREQLAVLWEELGPNLKTQEARDMRARVLQAREVMKRAAPGKSFTPKSAPPLPPYIKLPDLPSIHPEHDHTRYPNGKHEFKINKG